MSDSYRPWDVPVAPVYGLLETLSQIPGISDTGFPDWLESAPVFSGARNFRDEEPGWSLATDIAASFIPYAGWAGALNKAGEAAGLLGGVNRARIGAANLFRGNVPLAFAAGESVAYAPVSAAITGFDALGERYSDPWDALFGFGAGTLLGGGLQALGHAAAPAVARVAPRFIGEMWHAAFEPGPQLSALYGFSNNQRAAASGAARNPRVQGALAPENEPQVAARALDDLIREHEAGMHQDVDVDVLRAQYDQKIRETFAQRPEAGEDTLYFNPAENDSAIVRRFVPASLNFGPHFNDNYIRIPLEGGAEGADNPDVLAQILDLPQGWAHEVKWPGLLQVSEKSAKYWEEYINLRPSTVGRNFRSIIRPQNGGPDRVWSVRQDERSGLWYVATKVSNDSTMSGRAQFRETAHLSSRDPAHEYFTFLTDRPGRFFPEAFVDTDLTDPEIFSFSWDKVPRIRKTQIADAVRRANTAPPDVPRNPFPADQVRIAFPKGGGQVEAVLAKTTGATTLPSGGVLNYRQGLDYILDDGAGNMWVVRKDIFEKTYKKAGKKFEKRSDIPVGYYVTETPQVIHTLEGPVVANAGDHVMIGSVGEMWPMTPERFAQRNVVPRPSFLDTVMDFNNIYLNPKTVKEIYRAWSKGDREAFVKSILKGPTMGEQIMKGIETYAAPTIQQLAKSPTGRALLGMFQATFEGAEDRAKLTLYGHAALKAGTSPVGALFGGVDIMNANALVPQLRLALQQDPNLIETLRQFDKQGSVDLASLSGTPAGEWISKAVSANLLDIRDGNAGIDALRHVKASDARKVPELNQHIGLSRNWDGSILYPIYRQGAIKPEAKIAGHSLAQAERKARDWIAAATADDAKAKRPIANWRMGQAFIPGQTKTVPSWVKNDGLNPGFLEHRGEMRGFEHEFTPYKHADEFIAELEDNYLRRWRYFGGTMADALTQGKMHQLMVTDPHAFNIVNTRVAQLKGQPGPLEERIDQIVDSVAAPFVGTKALAKAADATNRAMFQILHGMGNIVTPTLNFLNYFQTTMPMIMEFATGDINALKGHAYQFPNFGPDGLARPGFHPVADALGTMWGGVKQAVNPSDDTREVFQYLANKKIMGGTLANEYLGQDNALAMRAAEGVRGPEDFVYWMERWSSFMMQKSEQVSRTLSATAILDMMERMEAATGTKFSLQQKINNAAVAVERANYAYFKQDRPMMFTTPAGAVFGNQKTWMTNYLFMQAHYAGLAGKGNFAPLLMSLGTTVALGGVFAVPLIGAGIDAFTETFAHKDAKEFIFEQMGQGGNAISFGLPALFGMSLQGNVAAPGSNLAHDSEFFFSIVALERAKLVGRAMGRAYDDQVLLGINPMRDRLFQRQAAQAFAPRAMYRAWEALTSDQLTSAATGYPMARDLGWGARVMTGLGFRPTEIAIQYDAYASLLADKAEMRRRVATFGEAYATAAINRDNRLMTQLLQQATFAGLDINDIMRSAQARMRNHGFDMFGRNFNQEQLDRYQETLQAAGRH